MGRPTTELGSENIKIKGGQFKDRKNYERVGVYFRRSERHTQRSNRPFWNVYLEHLGGVASMIATSKSIYENKRDRCDTMIGTRNRSSNIQWRK